MTKDLPGFLKSLTLALYHDMQQGEITLRATGLVYSTLLSLVPLLALSFSVLKGFGVHNQMEPLLLELLSPLGNKAEELTKQVLGFVDNVQVGVLGVAGLATLLYTVVTLMQKIEESFNYVWYVKQSRSFLAQFRDYLSVVLIGPILIFSGIGLWGTIIKMEFVQTITTVEPFGWLLTTVVQLSPAMLIILAFAFLYLFIPNTRVKPQAALVGALFAGLVWQIAGWAFAAFVVSSGQQTAIYSIFASLFLFMLWMYVGWIIVLTGARLAYYMQYPDAVHLPQQPRESSVQTRELLAAAVLQEIGRRFRHKQSPPTLSELRQTIAVPRFLINAAVEDLIAYGILSRDDSPETPHYLLRVPLDQLTVAEIRRHFWEGNQQQQQQAQQVKSSTGFSDKWLADIATNPQQTVQAILDKEIQVESTPTLASAEPIDQPLTLIQGGHQIS